jgi:hypothetical protein
MCCLQVPNFRYLLLRRNLTDLKRTHESEILKGEGDALGARFVASDHLLHYPNGSIMEFGHCDDDSKVSIYLSAEYDGMYFDELVTFTKQQYQLISSSCRTTKPGVVPRVAAGTNPAVSRVGDASWIRRYWLDKNVDPEEDADYDPAEYEYIPSTIDDNPYINKAEYERMLLRLQPEMREAYRYGNWDVFIGQYFSEFRKSWHGQDLGFPGPEFPRVCGLDWGYASEGVCLFASTTSSCSTARGRSRLRPKSRGKSRPASRPSG